MIEVNTLCFTLKLIVDPFLMEVGLKSIEVGKYLFLNVSISEGDNSIEKD